MSLVLLASILLRLVALAWSLVLLARLRDWRMAFLSAMLALMALRQSLTLWTSFESWRLTVSGQTSELPGLLVSGLALGSVFGLHQMLIGQRRTEEDLRASRAQLAHSQKMDALGRLAGGVAHDFNNLLTAVLGFGELLQADLAGSATPEQLETLDEIVKAAERGSQLTGQLLAFSRKEALQPVRLNWNEAVNDLEGLLRRVLGEDIALEVRLDPELGDTLLDPGQAQQIITNLVVNARDAMPGGGQVRIASDETLVERLEGGDPSSLRLGTHVRLSVADSGPGIDDATRARLFEPFFTSKPAGEGTGLGLSTIFGIVRRGGGTVRVRSRPGMGATFEVLLPRLADAARVAPSETPATPPRPATPRRVLLAEDDAAVSDFVRSALELAGHRVVLARSGDAALAAATADDAGFDLLVSDIVMPGRSGLQLATILRRREPRLPIVLMSGYPSRPGHRADDQPERTVLLAKPFGLAELTRAIEEAGELARAGS